MFQPVDVFLKCLRPPGGLHSIRRLSKAIYYLKIYLFRNEFKPTELETSSTRYVCSKSFLNVLLCNPISRLCTM